MVLEPLSGTDLLVNQVTRCLEFRQARHLATSMPLVIGTVGGAHADGGKGTRALVTIATASPLECLTTAFQRFEHDADSWLVERAYVPIVHEGMPSGCSFTVSGKAYHLFRITEDRDVGVVC